MNNIFKQLPANMQTAPLMLKKFVKLEYDALALFFNKLQRPLLPINSYRLLRNLLSLAVLALFPMNIGCSFSGNSLNLSTSLISHAYASDTISQNHNSTNTITLNINNGDIRGILDAVAAISGCNIVADDAITGRMTLHLNNVPLNSALDIITTSKGYGYRSYNNTIIVAPQDNLSKYNNSTSCFKLSYASAEELKDALTPLLTEGKLSVNLVTNSLLYTGGTIDEQRIRTAIAALDQPSKQVTLEAKVIAVNRENTKDLGITWNWDLIPQRNDNNNSDSDSDSSSSSSTSSSTSDNQFQGHFNFWRGYSFNFNASLNALITSGKAKILATPSIITVPGKEAKIFIGDHIPVQTEKHDSSGSYTSTKYIDAGILLRYKPIVSEDGKMVSAAVHTEVSTPTLVSELKNYRITSRTADTNVRMKDGETLVIGGLINEEEQRTLRKVPILGDLPLLGIFFKNVSNRKSKTEVIMLLTPHVTDAGVSPAIYNPQELENRPLK